MTENGLPQALENALTQATPEAVFASLLPALGEQLPADRCFLHLRDPQTRFYRNICWRRDRSLWGILQPSIADRPREWNDFDRWLIERVTQTLMPIAIRYIKRKKD